MRVIAIAIVVGACGAPPAGPLVEHRAAASAPAATDLPRQLVHRGVLVGAHGGVATRSTWTLTFDEHRTTATLVRTEERAPAPLSLEQADRGAPWTARPAETRTEAGPVRHVGDHLVLELASPTDSLYLYCWRRALPLAPAGARRIARPGHARDCTDRGMWNTPTTVTLAALVCGQEDAGDEADLETHWQFGAAPGIERIEDSGDCFEWQGLRVAR